MTKLEKITHVSLIAVCCVSLFILISARFRSAALPPALRPNLVGQSLFLPGMDWHAAQLNVVLQISATCHFCNESMPFYQTLAAACKRKGTNVALVVSSQDAVPAIQDHLREKQVTVDKVLHSRAGDLGINATPTILVVNSQGIVKQAFVGKLDGYKEQEVLSIVERGGA